MRHTLFFLALIFVLPAPVFGTVYLSSSCDGTDFSIALEVFNDYGESYDGLNIIVTQQLVGICSGEDVMASPAMPMPAHETLQYYSFSAPAPLADQFYRFLTYVVFPDGSQQQLYVGTHAAGCGEAIAARGFLVEEYSAVVFSPCPENCWDRVVYEGGYLDFSLIDPSLYEPYIGANIAVDLYGIPESPYPMPGGAQLQVTQILQAPEGICGPVANEVMAWDSVKAIYR